MSATTAITYKEEQIPADMENLGFSRVAVVSISARITSSLFTAAAALDSCPAYASATDTDASAPAGGSSAAVTATAVTEAKEQGVHAARAEIGTDCKASKKRSTGLWAPVNGPL